MKTLRLFLAGGALLAGGLASLAGADAAPTAAAAAAATPKAPATPPLSPRFQQIRNRIDALFSHRITPPPPLDPRQNPFRPAGAFVAPAAVDGRTGAPVAVPEPQADDLALLRQSVATLKLGGVVEKDGKLHLSVNSRLFKEGDVIPAPVAGQTVYLRIRSIAAKSLTLALNDAEMTLKF